MLALAWSEHYNQCSVVKEFLKKDRPDIIEDILYDWLDINEDRLSKLSDEINAETLCELNQEREKHGIDIVPISMVKL